VTWKFICVTRLLTLCVTCPIVLFFPVQCAADTGLFSDQTYHHTIVELFFRWNMNLHTPFRPNIVCTCRKGLFPINHVSVPSISIKHVSAYTMPIKYSVVCPSNGPFTDPICVCTQYFDRNISISDTERAFFRSNIVCRYKRLFFRSNTGDFPPNVPFSCPKYTYFCNLSSFQLLPYIYTYVLSYLGKTQGSFAPNIRILAIWAFSSSFHIFISMWFCILAKRRASLN